MFHPEPLVLAYSEHLFAQALQAAPLYAATGNILLCYNLLFLSTFVLSGLGMYLLSRELTRSAPASVVAGLLYAFALYRVAQYPHLQALSSQWLPFALYGLRRFFTTRRLTPLAGATLALVAQNLSNGYYLIFFTPFVVAYCLYEIADRRLWADLRVLAGLAGAGLATIVATAPFLVPYLLVRGVGFEPRGVEEVRGYSADLLAWLTAAPASRLWGWLDTFKRPEGRTLPRPGRNPAGLGRRGRARAHALAGKPARHGSLAAARRADQPAAGRGGRGVHAAGHGDQRSALASVRGAGHHARPVARRRPGGGIDCDDDGVVAAREDAGPGHSGIGARVLRRRRRAERAPHARARGRHRWPADGPARAIRIALRARAGVRRLAGSGALRDGHGRVPGRARGIRRTGAAGAGAGAGWP